ncbi:Rho GTPase activation protein [Parasitella parasitica]|nr:Rho GTPase activation protein [Parasitella parasitica]
MHREDEIASINSQLNYVNDVIKWSISDLDGFVSSLSLRLRAEEAYMQALVKITENSVNTANNLPLEKKNYLGDYTTTFQQTTLQYEKSIEKTIELKRDYISCLKGQIDLLNKVKESHEQRRKKVKAVLGEKNTNYISFRSRDISKLHKSYINKCLEHASLQKQILISSHHEDTNSVDYHPSPHMARISTEEPRLSNDSGSTSRGDDNHSVGSSSCHDSSLNSSKKSSMAGFITQMRSQLANAAAASDPSKQNTRLAKLKKDITDTDQEYRQGIRILEFLRKKQIETAVHAMRHVEAILLAKSDAVKAVMVTLWKHEQDTLLSQADLVKSSLDNLGRLDGEKDTNQLLLEYEKLEFIKPKAIYYENYYFDGKCKEILFGSDLNDYAADHQRTVPFLVTKCIKAVEIQDNLEKEGIYRISGRQSNIDLLKHEFERDEESVELASKDVFTIASVLKTYLRELKQPLFSLCMQDRIEYSKIKDHLERKTMLITKLSELSKSHRDTLAAVVAHLAKVERYSPVNKMTMKNLSVIFTPALFHDHNQAENNGEWYSDKVLEELVLQHETLFAQAEARQQQQLSSLPSTNILKSSFSSPAITSRKSSIARRSAVLKTPSSIPNLHNTATNDSIH